MCCKKTPDPLHGPSSPSRSSLPQRGMARLWWLGMGRSENEKRLGVMALVNLNPENLYPLQQYWKISETQQLTKYFVSWVLLYSALEGRDKKVDLIPILRIIYVLLVVDLFFQTYLPLVVIT